MGDVSSEPSLLRSSQPHSPGPQGYGATPALRQALRPQGLPTSVWASGPRLTHKAQQADLGSEGGPPMLLPGDLRADVPSMGVCPLCHLHRSEPGPGLGWPSCRR